MKIREVIDKVIAFHPPLKEKSARDVVIVGNEDEECMGIAVCLYASPEVIRKAAEQKLNLLICHEPLFYSDSESDAYLEGNAIYEEKRRLLLEHHMTVWRDHDHIHGGEPGETREYADLIFEGIEKELKWEAYAVGDTKKPIVYEIPETTVEKLTRELMGKLNLTGARIVGDKHAAVKKVFLCEHVTGAEISGAGMDAIKIREIETEGYDVLIPFEIVDWTISEYVRDSAQLGRPRAIIEMGHFNVEELGMKYLAKLLPDVIGEPIPITYIPSGDSFSYIVRGR